MTVSQAQGKMFRELLTLVNNYRGSDFYASRFRKHHIDVSADFETLYGSLPCLSYQDLVTHPFLRRLYKDTGLHTKIIYRKDFPPLLVARTRNDIGNEQYAVLGDRPLVFFKSSHESAERCLWFYERNILPLVGEKNVEITTHLAQQYQIDSLWSDIDSLKQIVPILADITDAQIPIHITDDFSANDPLSEELLENHEVRFSLALPEAGLLATACPESTYSNLVFHPAHDVLAEVRRGFLLVTKLSLLPTPIIKYETGLPAQEKENDCMCDNKEDSFTLKSITAKGYAKKR